MLLNELYLTEGRGGYLYHATRLEKAARIIRDNTVEAFTTQTIDAKRGKRIKRATGATGLPIYGYELKGGSQVKGVSLTRNYDFAMSWSDIIFVFDQAKLNHNHKLIPTDHVHGAGWDYYSPGAVNMQKDWYEQYEEFVVGPIKNVSRSLVSVNVTLSTLDHVDLFQNEEMKAVYRHPLLNKVYPRKDAMYYDRDKHDDAFHYNVDAVEYNALKKQGMTDEAILAYFRKRG